MTSFFHNADARDRAGDIHNNLQDSFNPSSSHTPTKTPEAEQVNFTINCRAPEELITDILVVGVGHELFIHETEAHTGRGADGREH